MSKYERLIDYWEEPRSLSDLLLEDEKILWEGKPKKSAFVLNSSATLFPFVLIWLAVDTTIFLSFLFSGLLAETWYFVIPFFLVHLMPVWIWISRILTSWKRWKNTVYTITDRRLILRSGLLGSGIRSVALDKVIGLDFKKGLIDSMLHVGDLHFQIDRQKEIAFLDIEDAESLYKQSQQLVQDVQDGYIVEQTPFTTSKTVTQRK